MVFGFGALLLWLGISDRSRVIVVTGGAFAVAGMALWGRLRWAKKVTVTVLLIYAGMVLLGMIVKGNFRLTPLIIALSMIWFAVEMIREKGGEAESEGAEDSPSKPFISFVLLLAAPRQLTAAPLSKACSRAWGGGFPTGDAGEDKPSAAPTFVVGDSPLFFVKSLEALYMVHNFPTPYDEDAGKTAESIPDLRVREAFRNHRAWLAVDLMTPFDPTRSQESHYPAIARLIAELAGDDCLAIVHPESGRINAWDDSLKAGLRGPAPLQEFALPAHPPVLNVADDDPDLLAGKAEARERLPEFIDAFRRKDGEHFSIKAPVSAGGRTEHIWITVDRVDDEEVGGVLGNEPVNLGGMKLGDRVEVPISDVEDWVVVRGGSPIGLFTSRTVGKSLRKTAPPSEAP